MPLREQITVGGLPMSYEVHGTGPVLMLVAGTGYPGSTWAAPLVEDLAAECTVVLFDHRGTGTTPGTGPYTTRQFATDAVGLLDALGLAPAHVLGHSMGGRVAQWMALDHPEAVRTLILAATGPGEFDSARPVERGIPVHTAEALIERGYEGYMRAHIADTFFTPEFVERSPDIVSELVASFWDNRPSLRNYLEHVSARQRHQTAERLGDISHPCLLLVGDADTHMGGTGSHWDQSQYLVQHLPDATLRVIEGTKHGYLWQRPEESTRVVQHWIDQHADR